MLAEVLSHHLHWWDSCSKLEKVIRCNMLMKKVRAAFFCSYDNSKAWDVENAWLISLTWIFVVAK
jgi:hypothetical protein